MTPPASTPSPGALPDLLRILIPAPSEVGEGDNQAAAVNTEDTTSVVALAFAIEWVRDGVVDNINEAYALASCIRCLTLAVAFQAVLVLGPADLVIPENRAVAINYACIECFTYALAVQVVVSVSGPLSDAAMSELALLRGQLESLAARIGGMTPDQITVELAAIESQLVAVFAQETPLASEGDRQIADETSGSGEPAPTETTPTTTTTPPAGAEPTTTSPSDPSPPTEPPATEATTTTTTTTTP